MRNVWVWWIRSVVVAGAVFAGVRFVVAQVRSAGFSGRGTAGRRFRWRTCPRAGRILAVTSSCCADPASRRGFTGSPRRRPRPGYPCGQGASAATLDARRHPLLRPINHDISARPGRSWNFCTAIRDVRDPGASMPRLRRGPRRVREAVRRGVLWATNRICRSRPNVPAPQPRARAAARQSRRSPAVAPQPRARARVALRAFVAAGRGVNVRTSADSYVGMSFLWSVFVDSL
jgi:hypothetical protein